MDAVSATTGSPTSSLKSETEAARFDFLTNARLTMLDNLLIYSEMYSEIILDKMEQTTHKKAKTAVAARLTNSCEDYLTEEEMCEKEQASLVPLMTGGKLKSYQIKGVKWLLSLWQNGLNGILADQTGLGKTIQAIGFLAHLKGNGLHGPYMIIAPFFTLLNWMNEISRFVPSMTGRIYHGASEFRRNFMAQTVGPDFPIILVSYEMAMSHAKFLAHYEWKYVVVDEVHLLKDSKYKLLEELMCIPMESKLLLTGIPLQNDLFMQNTESSFENSLLSLHNNGVELWPLLHFILPHLFSSRQEFESWFDVEEHEQFELARMILAVSKLHAVLCPFILRRVKEDVGNMLPRKKEIIANKSEHQKRMQNHLVEKTADKSLHEKSDIGMHSCACARIPVIKNQDAINIRYSKDHATRQGTRNCAESSEKVAGKAAPENGDEGSLNLPSAKFVLEGCNVKRPRRNDAHFCLLEEMNGSLQTSSKSVEHLRVPRATSPEEILEALKEIPGLARADFLRAYSALIRDDRQFQSLMALPVDMRKDWLLMEIGSKYFINRCAHPNRWPLDGLQSRGSPVATTYDHHRLDPHPTRLHVDNARFISEILGVSE